jgi:hypothetical protein
MKPSDCPTLTPEELADDLLHNTTCTDSITVYESLIALCWHVSRLRAEVAQLRERTEAKEG